VRQGKPQEALSTCDEAVGVGAGQEAPQGRARSSGESTRANSAGGKPTFVTVNNGSIWRSLNFPDTALMFLSRLQPLISSRTHVV
jgi:hypothetical protein